MLSKVAAIISVINDQFSAQIDGISPPPLPSSAGALYITVHEVNTKELENLGGPSGLARTVIQINVWDHDYEAAYVLREDIKTYLLAFLGGVGGSPAGINVSSTNHQQDWELFDGATARHQLIVRLLVWFEAV